MLEIWLLLMTVEPMVTHADVGTFTLNVVSQNDTDSHVNPALLLPALELAFETVNAKYGQWFKLNHTIHSKECHDEHSLMKFGIDAVNKTCDEPPTNGFIGPSNDQHTIRFQLFSYSWSKPIITIAGMARIQTKFNDRIRRNMGRRAPMTRMGYYYYYDVARFIELIAARFRWGKVGYLATFTRSHDRRSVATCGVAGDAWYCRRLRDIAEYNDDSGTNTTFFTVSSIMETLPVNPEPADIRAFLKARIGVRHGVILLCASPSDVRKIMLAAYDVGMTRSGEYVFFSIDVSTNLEESRPWKMGEDDCKDHYPNASDWKERCEEDNQKASEAYRALKIITLKAPNSARYREIEKTIQSKAHEYKTATGREYELNRFVAAYYDAVMLYALALNETLTDDPSITPKTMDGYNLSKRMWNRTFDGIAGKIVIDENGDRHSDYSVLATNDDGVLQAVAQYYGVSNELVHENDWLWIGGGPPLDTPKCGYDNSKCPDKTLHWSVYVAAAFVLTFGAFGFFSFLMCRRLKLEHELAAMAWRIQWDEITGQQSILSMLKIKSPTSSNRELRATPSAISLDNEEHETRFARTTKFRTLISTEALMIQGSVVAIKQLPISKSKLDMTRPMLVELKRMKDMQHDHIARFVGACIDYPHYCVVTEYCSKGSLQDILENKEVGLDEMMMLSLVHDLVKAMDFIHSTDFRSHGNLKSSNCVVDSRFVLKVKDFGLCYLRSHCDPADDDEMLWTSPELLRMPEPPLQGTQKGDIYSFAIVLHEMSSRKGVFCLPEDNIASAERIIERLKNTENPPFRPRIADSFNKDLKTLILKCWTESPSDRPDFTSVRRIVRDLNRAHESSNIVDNLLKRMQQYAENLEQRVVERTKDLEQRTKDYLEEKQKAETLLYNILPRSVAAQLIRGEHVEAESFSCVTIYFSDIVGFTALSSQSSPMEVVQLLNDLYTSFDAIVGNFDAYKVETIGDAYMVVSGLPVRNGDLHAREIARMALGLLNNVMNFTIHHRPDEQLKLRIGIHSGMVCAGVVGLKRPRYCLFGDTVNTASRMESNGLELKIHVSEATKLLLDVFDCFELELRGKVSMKGKGVQTTYWLLGEKYTENLVGSTVV